MKLSTWAASAGAVVLTLGLLTTGSIAASAAPVSTSTSSDCQFGEHLLHVWLALPADLRGDLAALKDLEPGERGDAARDIRDGALDGQYGPGVQHRAERVRDRRVAVISAMPEQLRSDLVDLRDAAPADRKQLAQDIADKALAGDYGTRTQKIAERVKASDAWQNCVAG